MIVRPIMIVKEVPEHAKGGTELINNAKISMLATVTV